MVMLLITVLTVVLIGFCSWFFLFGNHDDRLMKYEKAMTPLRRHHKQLVEARLMELSANETALDTDIAHAIREALAIKPRW